MLLFLPGFTAATQEGFSGLFNVNAEVSIPTWYSQTQLFMAAIVLFIIASQQKVRKKLWRWLGIIFVYLSIDEGAAIHELFSSPMRKLIGVESGPLFYSWIVLFGALFIIFGLVYAKFVLQLPKETKCLFIVSGLVFVGGAIGFEMIGASIAAQSGEFSLLYGFMSGIEEFLEMAGISIFIFALIRYFNTHVKAVSFTNK